MPRPRSKDVNKLRKEVLKLYGEGFNASQIAKLKGFSRQYVARLLRDLKAAKPEIINSFLHQKSISNVGVKNVHAQRIRAFVHYRGSDYKKSSSVFFKDFVPGVDVSCKGRFIYARSNGKKFFGEDEVKAMWNSLSFWSGVLSKLEDRLGVLILKDGVPAFEFLYEEWETGDSPVAIDAESRGYVWRVFHQSDGKLRLSVDWSDGVPNHEAHHARDGHVDSVTFGRFVNDVCDSPQAPSFSQLSLLINDVVGVNKETAQGLKAVVDVLKAKCVSPVEPVDLRGVRPDYFG